MTNTGCIKRTRCHSHTMNAFRPVEEINIEYNNKEKCKIVVMVP